MLGDALVRTFVSDTNRFLYYRKGSFHEPNAPFRREKWTYAAFLANLTSKAYQFAYFFITTGVDMLGTFDFIQEDLPFLDAKLGVEYGNFFIHEDTKVKGIHCRFGMPGIITEGHFDAGLNMIAMIRGSKRYLLSPPSSCHCQYNRNAGPSARHTQVDWSAINDTQFPFASKCAATEAVLSAGDILYLPSYWFHHIVSLDASIQCNARSGIIGDTSFLKDCGF